MSDAHGTDQSDGVISRQPRGLYLRGMFLFINFFLIITAYYQVKPASRSLFIEHLGADSLPYVWIGTAIVLAILMTVYHRMVAVHSRYRVVLGTCWLFLTALVLFRLLLIQPGPVTVTALYILVDILGVVFVEQFWSLTNSLYTTQEGKRWYGLVGAGGLTGGVAGGVVAGSLVKFTPMGSSDLLLVAAIIIALIGLLTMRMAAMCLYRETEGTHTVSTSGGWRILRRNRYLLLIAGILLLAQLAQPVIEYQFLKTVEQHYQDQDLRTAFLSFFFSALGMISILVNLVITPAVHRFLGVIAGLLTQPIALTMSAIAFAGYPTLALAGTMKIVDRGLSYSINRASRELLYVPIAPRLIYQAKAWIDMFGYRFFKVAGSVLVLLATQWLPWKLELGQLSWLTVSICLAWIMIIAILKPVYRQVYDQSIAPKLQR